MKLTGTIIAVHSAKQFADGIPRVSIRFNEAQGMMDIVQFHNPDGLRLDNEVEMAVIARELPLIATQTAGEVLDERPPWEYRPESGSPLNP